MSHTITVEESIFKRECKDLGIDAWCMNRWDGQSVHYSFYFKSDEDINLYKLAGTIKERDLIKFRIWEN